MRETSVRHAQRRRRHLWLLLVGFSALSLGLRLSGCAVRCATSTEPTSCSPPQEAIDAHPRSPLLRPRLMRDLARMPDGYRLPFQRWGPTEETREQPRIVVLGLHGFNDYSQAFKPLGEHLAEIGVVTYAFDQRGFGRTLQTGRWHGSEQLAADLRTLIRLLRARHPQARLILIGESMGAAVALSADAEGPLDVDGLVLIAPAVWSRDSMPWYQRLVLEIAARTLPGLKLTGEGVPIHPSDNEPMLIAMGRDPLVIKATRVEALWGVTNLMDRAVDWPGQTQGRQRPPTLILYGERDSIIPPHAFCRFIEPVALNERVRLALYENGWHMLPRDLQGKRVRSDIASWLQDPRAALPSTEEVILSTEPRAEPSTAPGAGRSPDRLDRFCASTAGVEVDATVRLSR